MIDFVRTHLILERLAGPLLHFLWQGALLAALTAVLLRLLARRSAEIRYAVAIGALLMMAAAPVLSFLFDQAIWSFTRAFILTLADGLPSAGAIRQPQQLLNWSRWIAPIVIWWLAGVGFCTGRLTVAWYFTRKLRQTAARNIPENVTALFLCAEALLRSLARQIDFVRPVALMVSDQIGSPLTVGWLRPVVLLPVTALTGLNETQLRAVLAHELAHIRRHDFLVNVLQRGVESLLFYHPAVWWLSARIRAEREHCCDDLAVRVCGDAFVYAQALVELEQVRTASSALAMTATGTGLTRRVLRLLGRESSSNDWRETILVWAFLLTIAVGTLWPAKTANAQSTLQPEPASTLSADPAAQPQTPPLPALAKGILPQARELLLSLAGSQNPQQAPAAAAAAQANETASIEGLVVRLGTNDRVARANVTLYLENLGSVLPPLADKPPEYISGYLVGMWNSDNTQTRNLLSAMRHSAITDENGKFTFSGVKPGRYRLSSTRNGYIRGEYGQRQPGSAGTPIVVSAKQALKDVRIALTPAGAITGRIYDAANEPFRNATINAFKYAYENGRRILKQVQEAKSNDLGDYRLADLQPGRYVVSAAFWPNPGVDVNLIEHPLEQPDNPADRAFVPVFYPGATESASATLIDILPGAEFPAVNLTIMQKPTVRVTGRIINGVSSQPAARVKVTLTPRKVDASNRAASQTATASESAIFEFGSVLPGSYDLAATLGGSGRIAFSASTGVTTKVVEVADPENRNSSRLSALAPIEVGSFDVENVTLVLQPSFDIPGKIEVEGLRGRAGSNLLSRSESVAVVLDTGTPRGGTAFVPSDDGSFTMRNITAGDYRLSMMLPRGAYVKSARLDGNDMLGSLFRIDAPPRGQLEIVVSENSATLDAVVHNDKQEPAAGVIVALVPDTQRERFDLYRSAITDAEGKVHIDGIIPGNYKAFAWDNVESGAWTDPDFLRTHEARGKSLRLGEDDKSSVDLTVIP